MIPPLDRRPLAAVLLGLALVAGPSTLTAQSEMAASAAALAEASALLERARTAAPEAQLLAYARAVDAHELALEQIRAAQRSLRSTRAAAEADRAAQARETAALLGTLQRIGQVPAPLLLSHPGGADKSAQAAALLSALLPDLRARAQALRADLDATAALADQDEALTARLTDSLTALRRARDALAEAVASQAPPPPIDPALMEASRTLGGDLGRFAEQIVRAGGATGLTTDTTEAASASFLQTRGQLPLPARGEITARFGSDDGGVGQTLTGLAGGLVTAPMAASVRFAGPFLGYGTLVILEPHPGWLLTLGNLGALHVRAGDTVLPGAPLGALAAPVGADEVFLNGIVPAGGETPRATLYMELRENGVPVDPYPWFAVPDRED
ncbi:MAG: peptidoglycan DD-metalloendopeptidase family protein [Pseudomonadota bacterium]